MAPHTQSRGRTEAEEDATLKYATRVLLLVNDAGVIAFIWSLFALAVALLIAALTPIRWLSLLLLSGSVTSLAFSACVMLTTWHLHTVALRVLSPQPAPRGLAGGPLRELSLGLLNAALPALMPVILSAMRSAPAEPGSRAEPPPSRDDAASRAASAAAGPTYAVATAHALLSTLLAAASGNMLSTAMRSTPTPLPMDRAISVDAHTHSALPLEDGVTGDALEIGDSVLTLDGEEPSMALYRPSTVARLFEDFGGRNPRTRAQIRSLKLWVLEGSAEAVAGRAAFNGADHWASNRGAADGAANDSGDEDEDMSIGDDMSVVENDAVAVE